MTSVDLLSQQINTYEYRPVIGQVACDQSHGLWTPNEGINQRNMKIWADVAGKICFGRP